MALDTPGGNLSLVKNIKAKTTALRWLDIVMLTNSMCQRRYAPNLMLFTQIFLYISLQHIDT